MMPIVTVLLLAGCSPPESFDDTSLDTADDSDTGADTVDEGFPADELEDALQALLAFSMQVSATSVMTPYMAGMEGASETCPTFYESESGRYWSDICTAESGTRFDGGGSWIESGGVDAEAGTTYADTSVISQASIRSPEGDTLTLDGQVTARRTEADDGSYVAHASLVQGDFTHEGAPQDWLVQGPRAELVMQGRYEPATGGRAMYLNGGVFEMAGAYPEVIFYDLLLVDAASGGACPTEPGGVIAVTDPTTGQWWDVTFDGESTLGGGVDDPAKCDGCGEVRFYGQLLGEVCLDFSVLTDWDETPW